MYTTATELYDEGLDQTEYDDADYVNSRILTAQNIIERVTGKWFDSRPLTVKVDGSGAQEIRMPAPIISVTKIERKTSPTTWEDLSLVQFEVYDDMPFDWDNPIIAVENFENSIDVGGVALLFPVGRRNIRVTGNFGWVMDSSGTTPKDIVLATKLLAKEILPFVGDNSLDEFLAGRGIKREETKEHHYERFQGAALGTMTGNPSVDLILKNYVGTSGGGCSSDVV